ncbi:MAG: PAS domain-containing protein [Oscillochloris sp.]|nr:PAS domain-containing protein [Oscillochloris sp.]
MHYASDAPEMPPADNTLLLWRRQAVAALLRILAIVSLPLILIDALQQIRAEQWPMLAWHLSIGVLVGGFAIAPGLSYKLRAGAAVALLLASGLIGLGYYGLFSISYGLALLSVVFAILLLGPQAALLAIIGLGAGYGLIFAGFGNGLFPYPQRFFDNLAEAPVLFNHWLLVLGSAAILAITLGSLLKVVQSSLHTAQTARSELEHLNHALETTAFQHTTELERETLLRSINETLPNAFLYQVIQRADFSYERYTYLSPSMERLFGLTTAEILADPSRMRALLHPDDQPRLERVDREAVQQRVPFDIEVRMHKADGQIGWFHIRSLIAQELDDGRIIWNGLALEISARKQAELALAEQLRYAEALARCSQVLLADGTATNNWVETVQQALETLRVTIGCCRVALRFYRTADEVRAVPIFVIASQDPTAPPHREHPVNLSDVPPAVIERLAEGKWVAGRMAELFPDDNSVRHHLEVNARNSLLFMGIHVAGLWRGYLAASDSDPDWIWSESQVAFFRTGLDMIAAFMQQWETTATLRTRESLLFESQVRQESLLQAIPDLLLGVDAQGTIRFAHTPPEAPLALPTTVIGRRLLPCCRSRSAACSPQPWPNPQPNAA